MDPATFSAFPNFPLSGKIVAITGAGSGINLAFAELAFSRGAKIIIADLKLTPEAQTFVKEANARRSDSVIFQRCDVTVWRDLRGIFEVSKERFGDVPDVYVPGAGVFEPNFSNFWEDPEFDNGYSSIAINLSHPIKLTRLAIRALLGAQKQGVVLLLSSVAGLGAYYPVPLYAATKHAIVGFGRSLAEAAALQGVKIVTICPGLTKTPLFTNRPEVMDRYNVGEHSLKVSTIASHMASLIESSSFPGGTVLEVTLTGARVVPLWGAKAPTVNEIESERVGEVIAPILAITDKEKGAGVVGFLSAKTHGQVEENTLGTSRRIRSKL